MKHPYSFHSHQPSLDPTYQHIYQPYTRIFKPLPINPTPVVPHSPPIPPTHTHHFIPFTQIPQHTILYTNHTHYPPNIQNPQLLYHPSHNHSPLPQFTKLHTPNLKTPQQLPQYLNTPLHQILKTIIFKIHPQFIIFLLPPHHQLNQVKLKSYFRTQHLQIPTPDEIVNLLHPNP
ncbi:YbaK/EbsC family protein, partial [Staphylococcus epidermidis]|uniref:YbaK/EbsC family protein n=1 Tax=Staphylococcus epidermidis TaxID=1282 RepID=UPI0037DA4F10